jgi:O-antigen/teichoic acid export membrane protein
LSAVGGAVLIGALGVQLLGLFGPTFTDGYGVLLVLMLSIVPEVVSLSCYQIIQSQARMWLSFFAIALPRDLTLAVTAYFLVPTEGARGLAIAYVIAWTVALVIILTLVLRLRYESIENPVTKVDPC